MSFIERLKNTFLPKNLSMSITIGLVILVILISKLGVKNIEIIMVGLAPILTSPYLYSELKKRDVNNKKIIQIFIAFYSFLIIFMLEEIFLGKAILYIKNYKLNVKFIAIFLSFLLIILNKAKLKFFTNKKKLSIILIIIWGMVFITPIYNLLINKGGIKCLV